MSGGLLMWTYRATTNYQRHAEKELIHTLGEWVCSVGGLTHSLRQVHNHAVHFSSIDLDENIRTHLCSFNDIIEIIEEIEKQVSTHLNNND
jgi:hypothetical protein